jgi:predicted nucleotidyltransferase
MLKERNHSKLVYDFLIKNIFPYSYASNKKNPGYSRDEIMNNIILMKPLFSRSKVEKLMLFGSYLSGKLHRFSDLDIMIMFKPGADSLLLSKKITNSMSEALEMKVDVLVLNNGSFKNPEMIPLIESSLTIIEDGKYVIDEETYNTGDYFA